MKEINGNSPQNARININYSGLKPKVKFSYPDKKNQVRGGLLTYFFILWAVINLPIILIWQHYYYKLDNKELYNNQFDLSNYSQYKEYYVMEDKIQSSFNSYNSFYFSIKESYKDGGLFFVLELFLVPILIYFPFRKHWDRIYPDIEAFLSRKKYKKFNNKDILYDEKEINSYYIELPIFNNVICDFKATKDFSKYLKEFEIQEYKFKYFKKTRCKKSKKRKRQLNEWIWYARWYFSNKPEKGHIEVIFK